MKIYKKLLAILLCAAILMSLGACGGSPTATDPTESGTTAATNTPTLVTVPTPDARELYNQAKATLDEATDLELGIVYTKNTILGGETFTETATQKLTYYGLGTDSFAATLEETLEYPTYDADLFYTFEISEVYHSGNAYYTEMDSHFTAHMTQEDYLSRFAPALMIDASLYETAQINGDSTVITFSDATAMEDWLAAEGAELVEASGSVTLDENGTVTENQYSVTYTYGPAQIELLVTITLTVPGENTIAAPAAETYNVIDSFDAPRLLLQAWGYAEQSSSMSYSSVDSILSQAAAFVQNSSITMETYGSGDDLMASIDQSIYQFDYNRGGERTSYEQEEDFRDGVYSLTVNGEVSDPGATVTEEMVTTYVYEMLADISLDPGWTSALTVTDLGSTYLIEYVGTEDWAVAIRDWVCANLFTDPDLLSNLASAYTTNTMEGYVAIDKYTGLPTSTGMLYEGTHTIEGQDYLLTYQQDQSLTLASMTSHEALTEEPVPGDEPQDKATPLFYKVTGPEGQEMWLLGTIHVGDIRTGYLPQEIYDALLASDALAVECDVDAFDKLAEDDESIQEEVSNAYYYSDGSATADHIIDTELYEAAVRLMKATGNYNMNTEYLKPSIWSQAIDNFYLQQGYCLTSDRGVDTQLIKMAKENEIEVREIESSLFQIGMMTGYSDALQEELLAGSVETDAVEYWRSTIELFEMWCGGDEAALIEYLTDDTSELTEEELVLYNEYNTAMMTDRNAGMLETAKEYLESGETVFYAVGLAHLLAEDGLVFTLRDAGYTVELVPYA